jgi:hypothetical protein
MVTRVSLGPSRHPLRRFGVARVVQAPSVNSIRADATRRSRRYRTSATRTKCRRVLAFKSSQILISDDDPPTASQLKAFLWIDLSLHQSFAVGRGAVLSLRTRRATPPKAILIFALS